MCLLYYLIIAVLNCAALTVGTMDFSVKPPPPDLQQHQKVSNSGLPVCGVCWVCLLYYI